MCQENFSRHSDKTFFFLTANFFSWNKNFFLAARARKPLLQGKNLAARKKYFVTISRNFLLALVMICVGVIRENEKSHFR